MSVGAKMIAAHDEILLTCSFCCRLTSVCRRATSAECTVSEWMRRAGEPDELARQLVDHPAEHGVEHSLRAEREQLRVLLEATPHRTHVGRLRVPDRDQEVGPREQVQLACASPAGCRSRRGCGASPPGGRPRRWRCRSGSWSSPLRTGARIAGAREDRDRRPRAHLDRAHAGGPRYHRLAGGGGCVRGAAPGRCALVRSRHAARCEPCAYRTAPPLRGEHSRPPRP